MCGTCFGEGVMTPGELAERLLDLAVRVAKVVDALPRTRMGRHVADQLMRSATAPAANYEEGCAAESRADFEHKLAIALKELRESRFWLRFIIKAQLLPSERMEDLLDECTQLGKIIGKSIATSKGKPRKQK